MLDLDEQQIAALDSDAPADGIYGLTYRDGTVERLTDTDSDVTTSGVVYSATSEIIEFEVPRQEDKYLRIVRLAFSGKRPGFFNADGTPIRRGHILRFGFAFLMDNGAYTRPFITVPWRSKWVGDGHSDQQGTFTVAEFESPLGAVDSRRMMLMAEAWLKGRAPNSNFLRHIHNPQADNRGRS